MTTNAVPNCAKCGKVLSGKVKIAAGKRYHEACAPTPSVPMKPIEVQAEVVQPPDEPEAEELLDGLQADAPESLRVGNQRFVVPEAVQAKPPASEMRHITYFNWQGLDGTVFSTTVRGSDLIDFVQEWNATIEWIVSQGGVLVNTGKSQYSEAPKVQTATVSAPSGPKPSVPESVQGQTQKFEVDGVNYMVGEVKELRVKFLDKSNKYVVSVKVPPFLQFGVTAWKEVAEPIWGDLSKRSLIEPLPITENLKYCLFSLREDGKPNKVVEFRATKQ